MRMCWKILTYIKKSWKRRRNRQFAIHPVRVAQNSPRHRLVRRYKIFKYAVPGKIFHIVGKKKKKPGSQVNAGG